MKSSFKLTISRFLLFDNDKKNIKVPLCVQAVSCPLENRLISICLCPNLQLLGLQYLSLKLLDMQVRKESVMEKKLCLCHQTKEIQMSCNTNKSSNTMKNTEVEYLKYLPPFFGIRLLLKPLDTVEQKALIMLNGPALSSNENLNHLLSLSKNN